jgi:hypothetical protein
MINKIKKSSKFIFVTLICVMFTFTSNLYASSVSISSTPSLEIGVSTNVAISASDATGRFNIASSNSGVVSLSASSVWVENNSTTITATAKAAGTVTITLTPVDVSNSTSGDDITGSIGTKTISIKVNAPVTNTPTNNTPTTTTGTSTATTTTNSNANLKKLVPAVEGLTPNFNPAVTKYALTVPATITNLSITAAVEATGAKYWVSGNDNLQIGDNTVNVTVTATDGTKKVYTIIVTKAADVAKANAYLNSIVVDGKTLTPEFSAETLEYDIGTVKSDVNALTVLAYAQSSNAKVEVTGNDKLVEGSNTIKIKVTAEDGVTTKEYTIKVTKEAAVVAAITDTDNETNALTTEKPVIADDTQMSFLEQAKIIIKDNLLVLLLLTLVIVEFIQVAYLYSKLHKDEIDAFIAKLKKKKDDKNIEVKAVDIPLDEQNKENSDLEYTPIIDSEKVEEKNDTENTLDDEDKLEKDSDDVGNLDIDYTFDSLKALESLKNDNEGLSYGNYSENTNIEDDDEKSQVDNEVEEDKKEEPEVKEEKSIFKRRSGFDRRR